MSGISAYAVIFSKMERFPESQKSKLEELQNSKKILISNKNTKIAQKPVLEEEEKFRSPSIGYRKQPNAARAFPTLISCYGIILIFQNSSNITFRFGARDITDNFEISLMVFMPNSP